MDFERVIMFRFPIRGLMSTDLTLAQFSKTQLYKELINRFQIKIERTRIEAESEDPKLFYKAVVETGQRIFSEQGERGLVLRNILNDLANSHYYFVELRLTIKSYYFKDSQVGQRMTLDWSFVKDAPVVTLSDRLRKIVMSFFSKAFLFTHIWINQTETGTLTTVNFAGPTIERQNQLGFNASLKNPWLIIPMSEISTKPKYGKKARYYKKPSYSKRK